MRAVVYDAPRSFTVAEIARPVPGPGMVRFGIELGGVCGTDRHIHDGTFFASFPLTPGHEPVGIVDAVGEGVDPLLIGSRVTANGIQSCGQCSYCRRGEPLRCRNLNALGVTGPGAFAEYMLAPAEACFVVNDLEADVAVLAEPTACAMHGLDTLDLRPGSDVLLFGAGPTGVIMAQLLRHGGAARVTVAAPSAFKLELARSYGIDETLQIDRDDPDAAAAAARALAPDGFDAVIDATGSATVSQQCVPLVRDGGTVLFYGVTDPADTITISPFDVYRREVVIKGSFAQSHSFPQAVAALRHGRVRTEGLITHRFGLDGFGQALDALSGDRTAHKIVIAP